MLADVVVDTNVLAHSEDPRQNESTDCRNLIRILLGEEVSLCVDIGFSLDEAKNSSFIGNEYIRHIRQGSVAFSLIVRLADRGMIKMLDKRLKREMQRRVNQIIRNKTDRIFIAVAGNSIERVLVSHDYVDFADGKRSSIKADLGVSVITANACCSLCEN